ncbi:hypothetical protein [Pseudoduganella chitinolytica]|uniref:Uncharacterized protein n=1 Tax=Pseudoduganella chitinolytica TaxID=34070 RepID=A0ABY8BEB1_9BURK|nr:hypothetical protein [Pseudoduganella chitinolytica]WEF34235.1 hypothetical protein PX653_05550 [Pseudoduganella chitinolytica]
MAQFDEKRIREAISSRLSLSDQALSRAVDHLGRLYFEDVKLADVRAELNPISKGVVAQFDVPPERLAAVVAQAGQLEDVKEITIFAEGVIAPTNWRVNVGMRM